MCVVRVVVQGRLDEHSPILEALYWHFVQSGLQMQVGSIGCVGKTKNETRKSPAFFWVVFERQSLKLK